MQFPFFVAERVFRKLSFRVQRQTSRRIAVFQIGVGYIKKINLL